MLSRTPVVLAVVAVLIVAGCSGPTLQSNSTQSSTTTEIITSGGTANSEESGNPGNKSVTNKNYTEQFLSQVYSSPIDIESAKTDRRMIRVNYTGNFSNTSRTTSEMAYLTTRFAEVINGSYTNKTDWNITRLNIIGIASNGTVVWDSITDDWWAMKYIRSHWGIQTYLITTASAGEFWNLSTGRPPSYGEKYAAELRNRLRQRSEVQVLSLDSHGAEAFLTYETDHELNSSQYFDEVAKVVDVYKNLTLPRRFNRTDGWYAGILNIEIRDGSDTLEWYRYQIRWAEARINGEMTRQEEAYRLRKSRFLEKDRLRDTPEPDE